MDLTAGTTRLSLDDGVGARVSSLLVTGARGDLDLAGRYQPTAHGWGAFPMAPWAGRVRDGLLVWHGREHQLPVNKPPHAIHGLVATVPWDVVSTDTSSAVLRRDVGDAWPWPAHAVLRYELGPTELTTVLEVHADAEEMPAWCGVHAWYPRHLDGAAVQIGLHAEAMLVRDGDIPTDERVPVPAGAPMTPPVDDTFAAPSWPVTLTWPGVLRAEVTADTTWVVVFTQREEAVAVEPQTAPPDAANLALAATVVPGEPLVLTTSVRWSVPQ